VKPSQTSRHKPSTNLLVLRSLLIGLLLLFVARHRVLGLYDLADGDGADAAVFTGGIVKRESMYALDLK
jgi:hypothetical protein